MNMGNRNWTNNEFVCQFSGIEPCVSVAGHMIFIFVFDGKNYDQLMRLQSIVFKEKKEMNLSYFL